MPQRQYSQKQLLTTDLFTLIFHQQLRIHYPIINECFEWPSPSLVPLQYETFLQKAAGGSPLPQQQLQKKYKKFTIQINTFYQKNSNKHMDNKYSFKQAVEITMFHIRNMSLF